MGVREDWDLYLRELPEIVLRSHGRLYPSVSAALKAIDWVESHSLVILGFDGLDTDGERIRPRLDRIADFSRDPEPTAIEGTWDEQVAASCASARATLTRWLGDVQFVDLSVKPRDD
jgi:hypothetical protein